MLAQGCMETDLIQNDAQGAFQTTVNSDQATIVVQTKANELVLTPEDYVITLENTRAEVLKQWANINEMPNEVRMVPGSYKLMASYGDKSKLPMYDNMPSGAEVKFVVEAGMTVPIALDCTPQAAMITVEFDPTFDDGYSSYEMALKTKGDSLLFTKADQNREAFLAEGKLNGRLYLVKKDEPGKIYTYTYNIMSKAYNATHYKLTFKPKKTTGHLGVTITTDKSTNDFVISPTLPDYWLPKGAPVVNSTEWLTAGKMTTTQGKSRQFSIFSITTQAGVKFLKFKTTSPELLGMGFPAEGIDLVNGSAEQKQFLKNLGLDWSKELDDPNSAPNIPQTVPVYIDFEWFCANMITPIGTTSTFPFSIEMQDVFEQPIDRSVAFNIEVAPPDITIIEPIPYYIWSHHAFLPHIAHVNSTNNDLVVEMSEDNINWSVPTSYETEDSTETIDRQFKVLNMKPNSTYYTRFKYGEHTYAGHTIHTETPQQVPNADFELWEQWMTGRDSKILPVWKIPYYRPWTSESGQYWATNNTRTVWLDYRYSNHWNSASAVLYFQRESGNKAAELRSTSASGGGTVNSNGVNYESHRTAGRLLIGSHSTSGNTETIDKGRPHSARPTSINFKYQYLPEGADTYRVYVEMFNGEGADRKLIGGATYTQNLSEHMSGFESKTINLNYDPEVKLVATHIFVMFESTTNKTPSTPEKNLSYPGAPAKTSKGKAWQGFSGSVLRIDDLKLNY